jgi:hypothetical protein
MLFPAILKRFAELEKKLSEKDIAYFKSLKEDEIVR